MWVRKIFETGHQKCMSLPKDLTDALHWKAGDRLLVTATARNIITITLVQADRVPESILREANELPTIAYAR